LMGNLARRPGAASDRQGFGDLAAQAGARRVLNSGKIENKHRYQSGDGLAPAGKFLGGSFGVSGTPPVA
jgi:hypothetical protein